MKKIKTSTALIIVLATAVIIGGGTLTWAFGWGLPDIDFGIQSPITVTKKTNTNTNKNSNTNQNTNTNSATADWKTYENTEYGFSFKYPTSYLSVSDKLPKDKNQKIVTENDGLTLEEERVKSIFQLWANPGGWGYENFSKKISENDVTVGGVKTTEIVIEDPESQQRKISVILEKDSVDYFITYTYAVSLDSKNQFDKILSTFQFTQ